LLAAGVLAFLTLHRRAGPPQGPSAAATILPENPEEAFWALAEGRVRSRKAMSHFRGVALSRPDNAEAQALYGWSRLERGDIRGAYESLNKALKLNLKSPQVHLFLGDLALLENKPAEALSQYAQGAAPGGSFSSLAALAERRQGTLLLWQGNLQEARKKYDRVYEVGLKLGENSGRGFLVSRILADQALLADIEGRTDRALELLEKSARQDADHAGPLIRLARFLMAHDMASKAEVALLESQKKSDCPQVRVQRLLVTCYLDQGKRKEAEQLAIPCYRMAFPPERLAFVWKALRGSVREGGSGGLASPSPQTADPSSSAPSPLSTGRPATSTAVPSSDVLRDLYGAYVDSDNITAGVARFREIIAAAPKDATPHMYLASLLEMEGKLNEARDEIERATNLAGKQGASLDRTVLGALALREGKPDQALEHFTSVATLSSPYSKVRGLVHQAYVQLWKEGPRQAEDTLKKALQIEPTSRHALQLACALDLVLGRERSAVERAERLTRRKAPRAARPRSTGTPTKGKNVKAGTAGVPIPASRIAALTLAGVLMQVRRYEEADRVLEKARRTLPMNLELHLLELESMLLRLPVDRRVAFCRAAYAQMYGPLEGHAKLWRALYGTSSPGQKALTPPGQKSAPVGE